jgi:hypothetical protein
MPVLARFAVVGKLSGTSRQHLIQVPVLAATCVSLVVFLSESEIKKFIGVAIEQWYSTWGT